MNLIYDCSHCVVSFGRSIPNQYQTTADLSGHSLNEWHCFHFVICRACRRSLQKKNDDEAKQKVPTTSGSPSLDQVIKAVCHGSAGETPDSPSATNVPVDATNSSPQNVSNVLNNNRNATGKDTGAHQSQVLAAETRATGSKPINIQHLLHLLDSSCPS